MQLATPRLLLRPMQEDDFPCFADYATDVTLCRMYGLPIGMTQERAAKLFHAFLQNEKTYAIILKATNTMIGHLMAVPPELPAEMLATLNNRRGVTMAYAISPAYKQQGFAFEALSAFIDYLFHQKHMDYIHCGYFDFNIPSQRLQNKLGFQPLGSHTFFRRGEEIVIIDNILYQS